MCTVIFNVAISVAFSGVIFSLNPVAYYSIAQNLASGPIQLSVNPISTDGRYFLLFFCWQLR